MAGNLRTVLCVRARFLPNTRSSFAEVNVILTHELEICVNRMEFLFKALFLKCSVPICILALSASPAAKRYLGL